MNPANTKRTVILLTLVPAFFWWIGDAIVTSFVMRRGAFVPLLVRGTSSEDLVFRLLGTGLIILCGVIVHAFLTKRNAAQLAQRNSEVTLSAIAGATTDAIIVVDDLGRISLWNPAAERIFGYGPHEVTGRDLHELLLRPGRLPDYHKGLALFGQTGAGTAVGKTIELTAVKKDKSEVTIELSLSSLRLAGKWHAVGIVRDITERKRAEEELQAYRLHLEKLADERAEELTAVNKLLRQEILEHTRTEEELLRSEAFLNTIFDSFHDPFSIVDRDFRMVRFNDAYTRVRGKRAGELYGKRCHDVLKNRDFICGECIVEKTFQSKDPCAKEKLMTLPDGTPVWMEIYTYPIFDQNKDVTHVIEYSRDITARKKNEEEIKELIKNLNHLSTTDSLTGLLNRRALNDLLQHEIDRAGRYHTELSLILCDVDKFKSINDTYGHTVGDRALRLVAEILKASIRRTDILGRYGGDEFMIIMPETTMTGGRNLAEKIRQAAENAFLELPQGKVRLSLSLGVAGCCTAVDNIDTVVAFADEALYDSKQAGRNKVSLMKQ